MNKVRTSTIYSIGHGNKEIDSFLSELKAFNIEYLLDVRSKAFSKRNPHFSRPALNLELKKNNITYVYVGDTLGGLPLKKEFYNAEGKVLYELIKEQAFFKAGLERIVKANDKRVNIALMCSESKPGECHRSKLIGQELLKRNISINHIISSKETKNQEMVILELTKGSGSIDLFGIEIHFTS